MKKVFLLDDEKFIRQGIKNSIDWESEGFIYCGDAPDGELALPLIEKHQPDIVITDIKMPFMDGLEVSRILRNKMPWIKVIILSGHDEFEYAREALSIQVTEYCLKPLSSQDFLEVLHKVSDQIDQENRERERLNELESQALEHSIKSQEQFLSDLCEGGYCITEAIKQASELDLELVASFYYVLILEVQSTNKYLIDEIEKKYDCLFFNMLKETVFIMKGESKQQLESEVKVIRRRLLDEANTPIFGFGNIENRIQGISVSFTEAEESINYSRIVHKYTVINPETSMESKKAVHSFNRNDLIYFLKFGDIIKITEFSKSYSSYLESISGHTPLVYYYFLMDFTITITHHIKESYTNPKDLLEEINSLELRSILIKDYPGVLRYMEEMLKLVFESRKQVNSKFGLIIDKTKNFVDTQFHNPELSLQTIADEVNVSASYLSHMFSQETGQTLTEYLTKTRIDHAKELLKTTNDKTYEIAHKVGYSDSHYFCHTFKKVTGITTKQFKLHGKIELQNS